VILISEQQLIHVLEDYLNSTPGDPTAKFQLERDLGPRYSHDWCVTVDRLEDMFEFFVAAGIVFDADEARELALDAKIEQIICGYMIYFKNVKLVK
jgi:hypothetical protein